MTKILSIRSFVILFMGLMMFGCGQGDSKGIKPADNPVVKEVLSTHAVTMSQKYITQGKPTMVFIYADWCPHCRAFKPAVTEVSKELAGKVVVNQVNYEEAKDFAKAIKLTGVPKILVFDANGNYVKSINGQLTKEQLIKEVSL